MALSVVLTLLRLATVLTVPHRSKEQCSLQPHWEDVWREASDESQISIVDNNFATYGQCVLKLEKSQAVDSFILRNNRYKVSQCQEHRDISKLCSEAERNPWRFLYRKTFQPSDCPAVLSGSHEISYSEYDSTSSQYIDNCGEPRSEINSCQQRDRDDPQITISLGKCPSGTLYHRSSLTETLQCLGSWQEAGNIFFVAVGHVWEYWEPGEYRNNDMVYNCMVLTTDGLNIYMAEGFGSSCDGLGLALTPYNGRRRLVLSKRMRLEQSCHFPSWLASSSWQVITTAGTISQDRTSPHLLTFNSSSSFLMLFDGEEFAQEFSCSKMLMESETEVRLQLFSQTQVNCQDRGACQVTPSIQCQGSYQCLEVQRSAGSNTLKLHLGAPTPHLEHCCRPPNMDEQVPYLRATLIPSETSVSHTDVRPTTRFNPELNNVHSVSTEKAEVSRINLETAEKNILAKINNYNNQFMLQVNEAIRVLLGRIKQRQFLQ